MEAMCTVGYRSATAIALVGLCSCTALFQGGTTPTTKVITPAAEAIPVDKEHHDKLLEVLTDKGEFVLQIASAHILESTTPQEVAGFSCLSQSKISEVESHGQRSDVLRKFIEALLIKLPRGEADCPRVSDQWQITFLTYSRWKTARAKEEKTQDQEAAGQQEPKQEAAAPSERTFAEQAASGAVQGAAVGAGVVAIGAAAVFLAEVYATSCIGTAGLICPIPGETIFIALGTSTVAQDGKKLDLVGVGVAQGSAQISAWSALNPDPEALGMAFAQAFKSLASNYAAVLVAEATNPVQSGPNP